MSLFDLRLKQKGILTLEELDAKKRVLEAEIKIKESEFNEKVRKKEAEMAEQKAYLQRKLEKSREYRVMLQDYQKELRSREERIIQEESRLNLYKNSLDDREKAMREEAWQSIIAPLMEMKSGLERETEQLNEETLALRKTELQILDWVRRMERNEQEVFDEIRSDAEKYEKHRIVTDGYDFEEYTAELLKKNHYNSVEVTKKSNDYGADVIAEKDHIKYVFQCKYYKSQVGIDAVQQIYAAKGFYNAHVAVVVTNSVFTKAAKVLSKELNVVLWDCETLANMINAQENNYG